MQCLTSDSLESKPALWWFSSSRDAALVESFVRLGNTLDGHLSCRAAPDEAAIFIEISSSEVGRSRLLNAAQSHVVSFLYRKDRTLQDYWTSWKTKVLWNTLLCSLCGSKTGHFTSMISVNVFFKMYLNIIFIKRSSHQFHDFIRKLKRTSDRDVDTVASLSSFSHTPVFSPICLIGSLDSAR